MTFICYQWLLVNTQKLRSVGHTFHQLHHYIMLHHVSLRAVVSGLVIHCYTIHVRIMSTSGFFNVKTHSYSVCVCVVDPVQGLWASWWLRLGSNKAGYHFWVFQVKDIKSHIFTVQERSFRKSVPHYGTLTRIRVCVCVFVTTVRTLAF